VNYKRRRPKHQRASCKVWKDEREAKVPAAGANYRSLSAAQQDLAEHLNRTANEIGHDEHDPSWNCACLPEALFMDTDSIGFVGCIEKCTCGLGLYCPDRQRWDPMPFTIGFTVYPPDHPRLLAHLREQLLGMLATRI
jgi:hypothetical protein